MDTILHGVMKYRRTMRAGLVEQFKKIRDKPEPRAVFFTCMDSRMLPTRFVQANVGDMFIVRNAGNLVPHARLHGAESMSTEPAALELGCIVNNIKHVIVCGHSDCKAMNLLHAIGEEHECTGKGPLQGWLRKHANTSFTKYQELQMSDFRKPLVFQAETPMRTFVAHIDPENRFCDSDKLSQVNTLEQLQNIASYHFLKEGLQTGQVHLHALWFDVYSGDIFYFSRQQKRFVEINQNTLSKLLEEVKLYYS